MLLQFYIACQGDLTQPTTIENTTSFTEVSFSHEQLRTASSVFCVDTNQDGNDEILLVDNGTLYIDNQATELNAGVQRHFRTENSLWFATGFAKGFRDAPMTVYRYDNKGLATVWTDSGHRNQITDLSIVDNKLYLAKFSEKTTIQGGWLEDSIQPIFEANMAMRQQPLPENPDKIIVGRLYGDTPRSDGDLFVFEKGKKTPLQNFRGIRSLTIADLNADGHSDLLVGDGWHYKYSEMGQARLSVYYGPSFVDRRTLAILDDEYTINHIELHRNKSLILAQGTSGVYILEQSPFGWKQHRLGRTTESSDATLCYTNNDSFVIAAGNTTAKYSLSPLLK